MEDEFEGLEMVTDHPLVGESQSNGAVENAIRRLQGQVRTLKLPTEHHLAENTDVKPHVWHWMVEYAADTFNRYNVSEDGIIEEKVKGLRMKCTSGRFLRECVLPRH